MTIHRQFDADLAWQLRDVDSLDVMGRSDLGDTLAVNHSAASQQNHGDRRSSTNRTSENVLVD